MKHKKLIGVCAAGAMLVCGMTGFTAGGTAAGKTLAAKSAKTVNVQFFTGKAETVDWMNDVINKFNKSHPTINVTQEYQKDASDVIKVKFASGAVPDIMTVYDQGYADQHKYMDLSKMSWWKQIDPTIKALCTDLKSGKQYRVATNITTAGIFYNKSIFKSLGLSEATTWSKFVSNLKTIKAKDPDVTPMFLGGKDSWTLGHFVEFWAHGVIKAKLGTLVCRKDMLYNKQSQLGFSKKNGCMDVFAQRFLELKNDGLFNSDALTATYDDQVAAFAGGKTAVISQGMWAYSAIIADGMKASNIGFCAFPPIMSSGEPPVILSAEDSAYLVSASTKHKTQVMKFLNYLFSKGNQASYSKTLGEPSAFKDVNANWSAIRGEVTAALKKAKHIGFTNEAPSGLTGDDVGRMVQDLYAGQYKTTLDFAKAYASAWNKAYKAANK